MIPDSTVATFICRSPAPAAPELTAEKVATQWKIGRQEMEEFALASHQKAAKAHADGCFKDEIVPIEVTYEDGSKQVVERDQCVRGDTTLEALARLKPVFSKNGTVTAANASKIDDGAAALVVCSEEQAKAAGHKPLARLISQGGFAQEPDWFTTAPAKAAQVALEKAGLKVSDIDRWEINEAFAVVSEKFQRDLDLDRRAVRGLRHDTGQCADGAHRLAIELDDHVTRLDARRGGRTILGDARDECATPRLDAERGGDVLGHRSVESTGIYLRLDVEDLRDVALPLPSNVEPEVQ